MPTKKEQQPVGTNFFREFESSYGNVHLYLAPCRAVIAACTFSQ